MVYKVKLVKIVDEAEYETYAEVAREIKKLRGKLATLYWIGADEIILVLAEEEGEKE